MLSLNQIRRMAGLTTLTEQEEMQQHMEKEEGLFVDCCSCLQDVMKMCEERLKGDLSEEHKKQYKELHECAKCACDVMKKHLESYK